MSDASFDPEALMKEAQSAAGLSDFGADDFREALAVLCETYDCNAWDERGRQRNRGRVLGLLATRLRVQEALRKHPEIAERPVPKPMVLTGMPRSGTSALFNLLAVDPAARPLLLWEAQFPDPAEGLEPGAVDPRYLAIKSFCEEQHKTNPEFSKIHFVSADTPEECVLLHALSLGGVHHGVEILLEPYASWYRKQDLGPMYRYYRVLLQLLDWQRPGERWLLKAPAHMWAIDSLIELFPDVSIVWSHREPTVCIASMCSMTHALMQGLEIDKKEVGPRVMDFYATSLELGLRVRDQCDPARFVDMKHDDFVEDPLGVAQRIYGQFGMPLDDEIRGALQAHTDANPKGKHGRHSYGLEEFGLDADRVRVRFADYISRFEIDAG